MSSLENLDVDEFDTDDERTKRKRTMSLLREMIKPVRFGVALTVFITICWIVIGAILPMLVAFGIDKALPQAVNGDFSLAIAIAVSYLLLSVLLTIAYYFQFFNAAVTAQKMLYSLRIKLFRHVQNLDIGFHERYTSGSVISRQTNDIGSLRAFLEYGLFDIVSAPLILILNAVSIMLLDWVTGVVIISMLIPNILITLWFQRRSRRDYRNVRTYSATLTTDFVENMTGIRAVKAFRREKFNSQRNQHASREYQKAINKSIWGFGIFASGTKLIGRVSLALVIIIGGLRIASGEMQVGALLALVIYTERFFNPIEYIANFYGNFQSASSALEKIAALLAIKPQVAEPATPISLSAGDGHVRFTDVRFGYKPDVPVLQIDNLVIEPGQTVAIVGQTGAGKSTIAKLLARFYDVSNGSITLDGTDLRDISDAELRQAIVMVTQESYLFSGSIADNIAIGKPNATRDEIIAAAEATGADSFIRKLPDGYDTDVFSRGGRLAAGQKQLVSFTRAFLSNPRVLILDEATSSLDLPSERAVQAGLDKLLGNRTAIIIAHRLATVMHADRVLVVHDGAIIEDGTPEELIAADGRFAGLYKAWQDSL